MIGVSAVGSAVDVATLFIVLFEVLRHWWQDRRSYAGLVALARRDEHVHDDRLQADLGVDEELVEAYLED